MRSFMEALDEELNGVVVPNTTLTENGALVYASSGTDLVDINFRVSQLRNATSDEILTAFEAAYNENPILAIRWLFYVRDIRGGLGERRLFRVILRDFAQKNPELVSAILPLIVEFGRWDDMFALLGQNDSVDNDIYRLIKKQLQQDIAGVKDNKSISLLGKWLPSINTSSKETCALARQIARNLNLNEKEYRKTLSRLREHLNIVERAITTNEWNGIAYEAVPSKANLKYNSAFLRHDELRRRTFLSKVSDGTATMHAATLYPYEIVHKYGKYPSRIDAGVEALWKSLPDFVKGEGNTLVVADGSGSMDALVNKTNVTRWEIAHSLAIYFAEKASGEFKDKYVTFSEHPQLVDLSTGTTLLDKVKIALEHNEVANTNIQAVFELILNTAIANHMEQEELPKVILIISDMEFDSCVIADSSRSFYSRRPDKTLFTNFAEKYAQHGYKLPKMIFWRVSGSTQSVPVIENELGVGLMSGYSPAIVKAVFSNNLSPYEILVDLLMDHRYDIVEETVNPYINRG